MNMHRAYFTLFPQGATVTTRAHGIDISKYDSFFLPDQIKSQLDFAIQRISYGVTRDEFFLTLVDGVMQIPIRGGYHYLSSWYTWREQADKYLDRIAPYDYHFHVCDFEGAFNTLSTGFAFSAWEWIHYIQRNTGKPCLLYTNPALYNEYIYPSQMKFGVNWNDVDLWEAQYYFLPSPDGNPTTPTGRTKPWKLWQYTPKGDGTLYGVKRDYACDLNVYNGPLTQMREWLQLNSPKPPPNGGTMEYVKGTTKAANAAGGLRVRKTASATAEILGSLPFGTPVEGYLQNGWIEIQYNGQKAYISAEWVTYTVVPPPAPIITKVDIALKSGSTVTTHYDDGSQKVETA